jgi:hypothetical protein
MSKIDVSEEVGSGTPSIPDLFNIKNKKNHIFFVSYDGLRCPSLPTFLVCLQYRISYGKFRHCRGRVSFPFLSFTEEYARIIKLFPAFPAPLGTANQINIPNHSRSFSPLQPTAAHLFPPSFMTRLPQLNCVLSVSAIII